MSERESGMAVSRVIHSGVASVSVRDLRNHGGDVVRRVLHGERVQVTMDGSPMAEIVPLPRPALSREELIRRWRHLPAIDTAAFRRDVDDLLDQSL